MPNHIPQNRKKRKVLPLSYSCMPQVLRNMVAESTAVQQEEVEDLKKVLALGDSCHAIPKRVYMIEDKKEIGILSSEMSSPRASRRIEKEKSSSLNTARDLLLSSLLSISAVPVSAFPPDEQKTVIVTLKEITERIRGLRERLSS